MSRGYWVAGIALGLIISLTIWYGWNSVRIYQIEKAEQRQSVARTEARNIHECFSSIEMPAFITCLYEVTQSDPDAERSDYDLQAQQEMAVWAYAMLLSSIAVIVITSIAAVFAWQQVIVARGIGEAQTRAYLAVEKIGMKWDGTGAEDETLRFGDIQAKNWPGRSHGNDCE